MPRFSKQTNMEGATHAILGGVINNGRGRGAKKSVDAFDFSISHLSMYERRLNLMHLKTALQDDVAAAILRNLERQEALLKERVSPVETSEEDEWKSRADATIVLMPYYNTEIGTSALKFTIRNYKFYVIFSTKYPIA